MIKFEKNLWLGVLNSKIISLYESAVQRIQEMYPPKQTYPANTNCQKKNGEIHESKIKAESKWLGTVPS